MSTESVLLPSERLFKVQRRLRKLERGVRNRVRSIIRDAAFVHAVWHERFRHLPLFLNQRCGSWYHPNPSGCCYFKSTDGHVGGWSFCLTRLNLHAAVAAASNGGLLVVDASQSCKRFPDSLTKTIPIWAAVLNIVVLDTPLDRSLYLPPWISVSERESIRCVLVDTISRMPMDSRDCITAALRDKMVLPLRCVWVDHASVGCSSGGTGSAFSAADDDIFDRTGTSSEASTTGLTSYDLLTFNHAEFKFAGIHADGAASDAPAGAPPVTTASDFVPLVLVSASIPAAPHTDASSAMQGWDYLPGSGDDAEAWAPPGLTPALLWRNVDGLLAAETEDECLLAIGIIAATPAFDGFDGSYKLGDARQVGRVSMWLHTLLVPDDVLHTIGTSKCDSSSAMVPLTKSGGLDVCAWVSHYLPAELASNLYSVIVILRPATNATDARRAEHLECKLTMPIAVDGPRHGTETTAIAGALTMPPSAVVLHTVPVDKPQHVACRGFARNAVLPSVLHEFRSASAARVCGAAAAASCGPMQPPGVLIVASSSSTPVACIVGAMLLLEDSGVLSHLTERLETTSASEGKGPPSAAEHTLATPQHVFVLAPTPGKEQVIPTELKHRSRANVARCQITLQNGAVPRDLMQELAQFTWPGKK